MNPNNPTLNQSTRASSSRNSQARFRLLPFLASSVGKIAACLLLMGVATLSQTARADYATTVLSYNPLAFWQLADEGNPTTNNMAAVDSSGNGFNGVYGTNSLNWWDFIYSPQPPTYPGFTSQQAALECVSNDIYSSVQLPALNLSPATGGTLSNGVTFAMWINPSELAETYAGLIANRTSAGDAANFGFGGVRQNGMNALGYTWNNNNGATYNWNSGLFPPVGSWSFVALVVQSNKATIYLDYLDPNNGNKPVLESAVNAIAHTSEAFGSRVYLGSDSTQAGNAANNEFPGIISDAAVFTNALSSDQILQLFGAGVGASGFAPVITGQPQSQIADSGFATQFRATGINGTSPIGYKWTLNGTDVNLLTDATNFIGANSNILTIINVGAGDAGTYQLIATNSIGTTLSSNATLAVQTPALVGEWFTNGTLNDVSGYSLAANHGAYAIGGGNYVFTNDVPPGNAGQSIVFKGQSGMAITNSSTLDANYDKTFDDVINHAFTISFWAKGWPSTWSPWVSKDGDFVTYPDFTTTAGWEIRSYGSGPLASFTYRDLNVGVHSFGGTSGDDMEPTNRAFATQDSAWHFYAGTFDGGTGLRDLYVDGVLAAQNSNDVPCILASVEHLAIGGRDTPPGNNYSTGNWATTNMEVFDVRIYNYALNNTYVQQLYGTNPPVITGQPQSDSQFANLSASFQVAISGTQPLALQWQLNGTNINLLADATNFSGINSAKLTVLSVNTNDVGSYRLTATNLYGSTISSNATLTIETNALVGEWIHGPQDFTDASGYTPAGTHDGVAVGAQVYSFTNDVPPYRSGYSLSFPASSASAISISNSSTGDPGYTNTYDGAVSTYLTVSMWVKGTFGAYSSGWPAFAVKNGESAGWQLRGDQWAAPGWTVRDNNAGTMFNGQNGGWDGNDDMSANAGFDGNWHLYTGTYNSISGYRALYIDGQLSVYETGNVPYFAAGSAHVTINCEDSGNGTYGAFTTPAFKYYDLRIYNYELSASEAAHLYTDLPPGTPAQIGVQPPTNITTSCEGVTVQINSQSGGSLPLTNQWTFNGAKLTNGTYPDGSIVSGANSSSLTIANVTANEDGVFAMSAANAFGSTVSSNTTLTVGSLMPASAPAGNLVGAWLTGTADLTDHSGYSPAGTHDGYAVGGSAYTFTNDVPYNVAGGGQSLWLTGGTGIAITNSSTLDGSYTNTFDDNLTNAYTVELWAKGLPGGWNPWVSKYGENGAGWQLRVNGSGNTPCWTIRGTGGAEDMSSTNGAVDGNWHHYAGTYDSVSGIRNLYVDGVLAATESGQGLLNQSSASHLAIGGRDGGGNAFGNYFTGEIYGVKIYNTALSQEQVNSSLVRQTNTVSNPPTWSGRPVLNGSQLVLTYSGGTLLGATNILGPWTPVAGATSPYTNNVTASPQMFFKLQ